MKSTELFKWRNKRGLTQLELATKLGITKTTIYRWEKGMRDIPPFLHLALECLDKKGGKSKKKRVRKMKKRKEVRK